MPFALSSGPSHSYLPTLALAWLLVLSRCARHRGDSVVEGAQRSGDAIVPSPQEPATGVGEVVTSVGNQLRSVYQSSDNAHWFGSNGQGLFRVKDAQIIRFTTEHGLAGNNVRVIAEDRLGNIITMSEPGGVSRFDGREFSPLHSDATKNEWRLRQNDLWFPAGPDTGAVFRYDGTTLHRLTLPKTMAGESWL